MMEKLRALIRNFFAFSKKETNAFLILLPLMVLLIFSAPVYRYFFTRQKQDFTQENKKLDSLVATLNDTVTIEKKAATFLRPFNPNTATEIELTSLGFSQELAKRLINYRNKGGKFNIKKDMTKVYGITQGFYAALEPYIQLPEKLTSNTNASTQLSKKLGTEKILIDLNLADSAQLKRVYGVGDKLSERIIKYREKLGGYVNIEQLKEIYGLDSTVVEDVAKDFFISSKFEPRKVKINTATQEELANHPYINRALARTIEAYRFQHGKFSQWEDLGKVRLMKESTLQKLKPYLSFDP